MSMIRYWVQRADFTSRDYGPVDVATAIQLLQSHDWPAELEFEEEREAARLETCSPGIGFVADDRRILHICPAPDGTALVHYQTDTPGLGLRASSVQIESVLLTNPAVASANLPEFVRRFYDGDHQWLTEHSQVRR